MANISPMKQQYIPVEELRYCIFRPGNVIVPLVPVDRLPCPLPDVPRQLTVKQYDAEGWEHVGDSSSHSPPSIPVSAVEPSPSLKFLAPDHHARASKSRLEENTAKKDSSRRLDLESKPKASSLREARTTHNINTNSKTEHSRSMPLPELTIAKTPAESCYTERPKVHNDTTLIDTIAKSYPKDAQRIGYAHRPLPPSGVEPDPSKKVYCTHWIKYGECNFLAQGCLYKHEMPSIAKLRELGFTKEPRWYKERHAVRPTWMQRHLNDEEEKELSEPMDTPNQQKLENTGRLSQLFKEMSQYGPDLQGNEPEIIHTASSETRIIGSQDLLIQLDNDEPLAPPPRRLQSNDHRLSNDVSGRNTLETPSPPDYPSLQERHTSLDESRNTVERHHVIRRHSQTSSSSSETVRSTQIRSKHTREAGVPEASAKSTPVRISPKKVGLADSKYADRHVANKHARAQNRETSYGVRGQIVEVQQRLPQPKKNHQMLSPPVLVD